MNHLSQAERKEISYLRSKKYRIREISEILKRSPSTISREIGRNSVNGVYDGEKAHHKAYVRRYWVRKERPKIKKSQKLENFIEKGLRQVPAWTPEQIAGRWNTEFGAKEGISITFPTIYKYLRRYKPALCQFLCTKRYKRRKNKKTKREMIKNRTWIDDRPEIVDRKERFGDWEGDTIVSKRGDKTAFVVILERKSRYMRVSKSMDRKPARVSPKIKRMMAGFPAHSLTLDNGVEFKHHEKIPVKTFFCRPYSSWQKGAVEYANRLLRRVFPKKSILKNVSPQYLAKIVKNINNTPRKCLNFKTSNEVFLSLSIPP